MTPERWEQCKNLFADALSREPGEQAAFLDEACRDDSALRAELEALLSSHDAAARALHPASGPFSPESNRTPNSSPTRTFPMPAPLTPNAADATPPADSIPGYKIIKELHRGGQGIVYQAVQRSTKRKVALKVMLEGPFAGPESKRRFEREIALVGSLRHPNIVPIFDSGVAAGRFYYAMEYIRGEPLADYAQRRELSVEDTLRLFHKVCDAVDYAHQKGVIHRDLKPANVLVDSRGEPHVLDFGLAKVGGAEADDEASLLVSVTGQVMGTLAYMSPEQASGRPDEVDMRSDVYALGVVLFELLTGQYPYDVSGQMSDTLRTIQETEPRRPSTVRRQINDEVETIVLKALAKEKDRRYITAGALGQDVTRYLAGDPIEAKRNSALYVLRKTLRRYKAPVAVATAFGLLLVASSVVAWTLYVGAEAARHAAQLAKNQETERAETFRRTTYFRGVGLAGTAYENNDIRRFYELLDDCPPDLRGWEWNQLNYRREIIERTLLGRTLKGIRTVAISSDGTWVVSGSEDGVIMLWNTTSSDPPRSIPNRGIVYSVAFLPGKTQFVAGTEEGSITLWDAPTGTRKWSVSDPSGAVQSLAFSPDGERVVSGTAGGTVRVWNAADGSQAQTIFKGDIEVSVWSVAWSPNGNHIAAAGFHLVV